MTSVAVLLCLYPPDKVGGGDPTDEVSAVTAPTWTWAVAAVAGVLAAAVCATPSSPPDRLAAKAVAAADKTHAMGGFAETAAWAYDGRSTQAARAYIGWELLRSIAADVGEKMVPQRSSSVCLAETPLVVHVDDGSLMLLGGFAAWARCRGELSRRNIVAEGVAALGVVVAPTARRRRTERSSALLDILGPCVKNSTSSKNFKTVYT